MGGTARRSRRKEVRNIGRGKKKGKEGTGRKVTRKFETSEEESEKKGRKAEGRMVVMSPRNWKNKTEKGRQKEKMDQCRVRWGTWKCEEATKWVNI